jgi:heme O synthase-like polyprenyltransferase
LSEQQLAIALGALGDTPRVVTPWRALAVLVAFGSADLYAWMDRNPDVRMLRTANATWVSGRVHSVAAGQAEQIIGHVAHPLARQQLREAARSLGPHP